MICLVLCILNLKLGLSYRQTTIFFQIAETWHPCAGHSQGALEHGCQPHAYKVGMTDVMHHLYFLSQYLTISVTKQ